jgi:crotonobetainyl-CoA:carnitine CoA-transferase CaiB-like acyl-CoA transferase
MERTGEVPAILGPYNLVDHGTGVFGTFATSLALYHRERTGEGQHAYAALAWTGTYHQTPYMLEFAGYEATEPRGYNALGRGPLYRFYKGSDVWFFLAAPGGDASILSGIEGLSGLPVGDAALEDALEERFLGEPASTWVDRLMAAGISTHAVVPLSKTMEDPTLQQRGVTVVQEIEEQGEAVMPGVPVHLSATPMRIGAPTRRPGSDAAEILEEIGMGDRLPALERNWIVQVNDLPNAW